MPRLFYVGAPLAVAALLFVPISAQTPAPTSAQTRAQTSAQNSAAKSARESARIEHVVVRGSGAAMEVEIQTSGAPVAPKTQAITGPDRIVVDFPGALPSAELRALKVNRGALKGIRSGLFFDKPPITRVVLDLAEPQSYRISTTQNAIVVTLGPVKLGPVKIGPVTAPGAEPPAVPHVPAAKLQNASLAAGTLAKHTNAVGTNVAAARVSPAFSNTTAPPPPAAPPKPTVTVTLGDGMLCIRAEKATFAQVLSEVQRQTRAEIAIPAGADKEEVDADLGPAPVLDVLASLLNGSPYNFILVGNELSVERVILTRRDPNIF
jgi:AMIN domain